MTVVPGARYGADWIGRDLFGDGWRRLWTTPVSAPVFDLGTYSGGLKIDKRGGGFQTITLHLSEKEGWREYRFRSVDKFPEHQLPGSLRGTAVGALMQDQTGTLFPAAPLLVPPFLQAIGVLHVEPTLFVMPDDPRLGEYRKTFAGMLGTVELKPEEAPKNEPGFGGSRRIADGADLYKEISLSRAHRVDEREFLAVRLVDFLIGDADRGSDNNDWARFGDEGNYTWRPLPRDRDRAFANGDGWINRFVIRQFAAKIVKFGPTIPLKGLTQQAYFFDRRLLQRLTLQDFEQVADRVTQSVTDAVIDAAISRLPAEWRDESDIPRLRATLIARRANLRDVAVAMYHELATETDIHLTADDERVDVERHADGRVTVTVPAEDTAKAPFYRRTFNPSETNEVRVYLGAGDDEATVRGPATTDILVRIIGQDGGDVLEDAAGGGATFLYDAPQEGSDNRFITKRGTFVSLQPWAPPVAALGFSPGDEWRPDWGKSKGWAPAFDHVQGAGIAVGVGREYKAYGFRRLPYKWKAGVSALVGTQNGRFALVGEADYRGENSPFGLRIDARASQLENFRFFGYGNDTPDIGSIPSLVEQRVIAVTPAFVWHIGWRSRAGLKDPLLQELDSVSYAIRPIIGELRVGPTLSWNDASPEPGSPITAPSVLGASSFTHAGLQVGLKLTATNEEAFPTRGWTLRANMAAYPPVLDLARAFNTSSAVGAFYLPLGEGGSNLAFRAGGALASGAFPAQYAPSIGGGSSLRGYRSRRFSGDASTFGSTELRVPVGTVNFLVRSRVGVTALSDVGRVWYNGVSNGGWHSSMGGGVWFSSLGRTMSLTYAHGEAHRLYLKGGVPF